MIRAAAAIIGALMVFAALFFGGVKVGTNGTNSAWQAKYNADLANANKRTADAEKRERDKEDQHADDMAALDAKHTKELADAKTISDRTIADLRAGSIRVRDRLTCPAASGPGTASQAGTGASMGDAAARGGLQAADAELVLRIAGEADEVAVQLAACQAIVRMDRGQ
ncbi:hypothetical protein LMG31506_03013 [Cupriavidus yeoncheonensis]|uniref:Lysis protein n=1 Tax=Cupriavidus yeoncheonensis TaxID=1462994 RepID=A0A916MVM8_9BURK|nr:lysis system i-spanin subunit Rz [Cupriavidus yeoncheonensis]CAG2144472.1 hypothetical protein LMG31506_03013 [Cupriavidus yeoncheonensis]